MNSYVFEELARAIARERQEEAHRTRARTQQRSASRLPFRSCLARQLVHAGLHLDHRAGELASSHRGPGNWFSIGGSDEIDEAPAF